MQAILLSSPAKVALLAVLALSASAAPKSVAPAAPAGDPGWPREINRDGVRLIYYQPQVDEWKNQRELTARIAFSLQPAKGDALVGVATLTGKTVADVEQRTVFLNPLTLASVRFPGLAEAEEKEWQGRMKKLFPDKTLTVSLDRLVALSRESTSAAKAPALETKPPEIFCSADAAILLYVDGPPKLAPVEGTKLQFAVNTTWDLFYSPATAKFYLLTERSWLEAQAVEGPWSVCVSLPADFGKMPAGGEWDHVRKAFPPTIRKGEVALKVFYTEKPAELIAFAGPPQYLAIPDTSLLFVNNTQSWVLFDKNDGNLYFLAAGRWFRSPKYEGPWTYAGNSLPADFRRIPENSPAADVRVAVPGTPEAADAILLARIPTTALVHRKQAAAEVKIAYDGPPDFQPIAGTGLRYAANTSVDAVLECGGRYYACVNAVWFVADQPAGPWEVATSVPPEIYAIPPSSPAYPVTYATVEPVDDEYVESSYTDGYTGSYVSDTGDGDALWWGSGWYYPPYYWGGLYPLFPRYGLTYGGGAFYNPATGGYLRGGYVYGPYGGAGRAAWYNPATGRYGRAGVVQGPYGNRMVAGSYNPRTGQGAVTRQGSGPYAQWGSSTVKRNSDTIRASHIKTAEGGIARVSGPRGTTTVGERDGSVYAGKDGNAYQRTPDGTWSKWENGGWQPVNRPAAPQRVQARAQEVQPRPAAGGLPQQRPVAGGALPQQRPSNVGTPLRHPEGRVPVQRPDGAQFPGVDTVGNLNRDAAARARGAQAVQRRETQTRPAPARPPSNFNGYHPGGGDGGNRPAPAARGGGGGGGRRGR